MLDLTNYERTYNHAVDLCANYIYYYRNCHMPLKSITLHPRLYSDFKDFVREKAGEQRAEESGYQFDSVNIEKGSLLQVKPALIEFWPLRSS